MRSKVVAAEMATAAGIPTVIANGQLAGTIAAAVRASRSARRFRARDGRVLELQAVAEVRQAGARAGCWSTPAPPGRCARAAPACCRSGSSTSAARSTPATRSRCLFGDQQVGKGISNYSADELRRVRGLKSGAVRELLPRASDEAVHRDYFVLA